MRGLLERIWRIIILVCEISRVITLCFHLMVVFLILPEVFECALTYSSNGIAQR